MLKISLKGTGSVDNAVIYLEDIKEESPNFLQPRSSTDWELDNLNITVAGKLNYSLYVLAFNGTSFECVITDKNDNTTVIIKGVTGKLKGPDGKIIKSLAHETGAENFQ